MKRSFFVSLLLSASLCTTAVYAENKAELQARLDRVSKLTALDDPALKPWNMKISFQLDDDAGKLKEQGTIEEWWAGPSQYKISIVSPSYTATTIVNKDGRFRTAGMAQTPYLLEVLERQMVHPMPRPAEVSGLSPETIKLEGAPATAPECVILGKLFPTVHYLQVGLLPTYCLLAGKDILEATYDYGNLMVARTAVGMFQQKVMPIDIAVTLNRVDAAGSHLLMLKTMALTEKDFALPASGMEPIDPSPIHIPFAKMIPEIASEPPRVPPPSGVKPDALSAPVQVHMLIGTDGNVHFLRLENTPDVKMAAPAMLMASQTTFTPHREDGKLVEVETTANIYFSNRLKQPVMEPSKPK